ncbi:MAG: peptidoglycan-associated lipoprotein Pal [Candidatus Accumulibacter sp.]|jgi:peptidoglycan-associated lipoprotein|nr:peptidoglycan-associated lipoprotein Pal [Accumulibacter sp.]
MRFASISLVVLLFSGCTLTPDGPEQPDAPIETRVPTVTANSTDGRDLPNELSDPRNILSQRSIYFDYNSFEVKREYQDLISAHARFLVANRQLRILIQGHTDERGSREYNLALGQKRADAVRRVLTVLGVHEDQIEAVSLGEEKPKNEGHDDLAWAENRRGDILYKGEY